MRKYLQIFAILGFVILIIVGYKPRKVKKVRIEINIEHYKLTKADAG